MFRSSLVALLVATVVLLSFRIGPTGTGVLAVFPIIYTSIMVILHHRVGGPATAAVVQDDHDTRVNNGKDSKHAQFVGPIRKP